MIQKLQVALIFGGLSAEHDISILSAQNIFSAIPEEKYEIYCIGISKYGDWFLLEKPNKQFGELIDFGAKIYEIGVPVHCMPHQGKVRCQTITGQYVGTIDVVFPILHGTYGEDGAIQGWAKMYQLPCVGPSILGSALGMDKEVMKRLLRDARINTAPFITIRKDDTIPEYEEVKTALGAVVYIKPVNMGSSVGVSRATDKYTYQKAIQLAFQYDNKVLIESEVVGREIECAVLGNENPRSSLLGEVINHKKEGFYDYNAKYLDETGIELAMPAEVTEEELYAAQETAIKTYRCLECSGMARVDMFLCDNGDIFINEINTLPGFTDVSMYPSLWKLSGVSNAELMDQLIQYAVASHQQLKALEKSR